MKCGVEDEQKVYTYEDLQSLQGKLTLAAGEKQKEYKDVISAFEKVIIPINAFTKNLPCNLVRSLSDGHIAYIILYEIMIIR